MKFPGSLKSSWHTPEATKETTPPETVQDVLGVVIVTGSPDVADAEGVIGDAPRVTLCGSAATVIVLRRSPPIASNGPHVHTNVEAPAPQVEGVGFVGQVSVPEAE